MAHSMTPPTYYLEPVRFPHPPVCTSDYLDERHSVRASEKYPNGISKTPNAEVLRRKFVRLLQVRYGKVDPSWLDMITGTIIDADKAKRYEEIEKWVKADQNRWIGTSSWIQKWIAGEIACHNQKVVLALHDRGVRLLKVPALYETAAQTEERLQLCSQYEEALREHTEHIQAAIEERIEELEKEMQQKMVRHSQEPKLVALRNQSDAVKDYLRNLAPPTHREIERVQDIEMEPLFYSQMDTYDRMIFWRTRWSIDVMTSWLWQFSGVLHFKANWDNSANQTMLRDRFVYLTDLVYEHILHPRDPYVSHQTVSSSATVRNVLDLPRARSEVYARFADAEDAFWPKDCKDPPGDHLALFVEATAHSSTRKAKRK